MENKEVTVNDEGNIVLEVNTLEFFVLRKALRKFAALATHQSQSDMATAMLERFEEQDLRNGE